VRAGCSTVGVCVGLQACSPGSSAGIPPSTQCPSSSSSATVAALAALTTTPAAFTLATSSGQAGVFAFKDSSGQPVVLSNVCPHQGCAVNWDGADGIFLCPCHGSQFDSTGNLLQGPARSNLTKLNAQVQSGEVVIPTC
ncbi:MAG: Rieske (2Fe-2S) protein, partial [Cyanobacteria bacterium REEB65]|nr:Rieske (2Fe-2S) protein [Cyanobacteria bacterium REEB65]